MLNVNQITTTLRGMSDQQLQQYAAMHKTDPFVFPLAFQESQTRQQMRAGKMAQMMGQKPPPIVDQDLAKMAPVAPQVAQQMAPQQLPEQQGIGALPAQNLEGMADGGIAGYSVVGNDQSGAPNPASGPAGQLAFNNEPVMRMAEGGIAHFKTGGYEPITAEQLKAVQYNAPNAEEMQKGIMGMAEPLTSESAEVYRPFEEYYKKQQAELSGRKDKNIDNALLTAGLSMLGGTSPYAFQNISKGGLEGLSAYNAAQKADEEAKRALMQSQLALAQAKQADKVGNRNYAAGLYEKSETLKSHAAQSQAKALEIKSTDQYHMGALQNAEMVAKNNAAYQQGMLGYHKTMADIAKESKPTGQELLNIRLNRILENDQDLKALYAERGLAAKEHDQEAYDLADKKIQNHIIAARKNLGMPPAVFAEPVQPKPADVKQGFFENLFNPRGARLQPSTTMGDLLSREEAGIPGALPQKLPSGVQFLGYEK
jgi:hypothetical protein